MLAGSVVHCRRLCLPVPALLAVLTLAGPARAQPTDLDRARALFEEAGELEQKGDWAAAQDRLRAALRIRETPHLRYALGWALESAERLLEARTEYEVALRLAQRSGADEVSNLASTRIAEIGRKIPLVQIRVRGALAKDTHVLVDGREVVVHGDVGTLAVDPGTRTVTVERSGRSASEETISVQPGVFRVVEVAGDEDSVVARPTASVPHRGARGAVLPWVVVAAGGAMAVGGLALFVSSTSDVTARNDSMGRWCEATACVGGTTATRPESDAAALDRREAYDAASRGNTKQIAGAILGGVGIASVAVGTYLLFTNRESADAPRAARAALRLDAAPLPGGGMAGASLAF
jgi:hypothetical protein